MFTLLITICTSQFCTLAPALVFESRPACILARDQYMASDIIRTGYAVASAVCVEGSK